MIHHNSHDYLSEHISRVVDHYRGQVFAWDVVNEAFDERGHLKSSLWYDSPGIGFAGKSTAYIEQAFRWLTPRIRKRCFSTMTAEASRSMKNRTHLCNGEGFQRRGVPIDGIGFQMHIFDLHPTCPESMHRTGLLALGIHVHITEMDVALPVDSLGKCLSIDLERQAELYKQITSICSGASRMRCHSNLGLHGQVLLDRLENQGAKGAALLFDRRYTAKPAYQKVRDALRSGAANLFLTVRTVVVRPLDEPL